jgi:hypothetical protein
LWTGRVITSPTEISDFFAAARLSIFFDNTTTTMASITLLQQQQHEYKNKQSNVQHEVMHINYKWVFMVLSMLVVVLGSTVQKIPVVQDRTQQI